MLSEVRRISYDALQEAGDILLLIKENESDDLAVPDSNSVNILRGLFYVALYAALEMSVRRCIARILTLISDQSIPICQIINMLHSVALDSDFNRIKDGEKKKLKLRLEFLRRQSEMDVCRIRDDIFDDLLQNITYERLQLIIECFSLNKPALPDSGYRLLIEELVHKRNQVAHGGNYISKVGRSKRHDELKVMFEAISNLIKYLLDIFEEYVGGQKYIKTNCRELYSLTS